MSEVEELPEQWDSYEEMLRWLNNTGQCVCCDQPVEPGLYICRGHQAAWAAVVKDPKHMSALDWDNIQLAAWHASRRGSAPASPAVAPSGPPSTCKGCGLPNEFQERPHYVCFTCREHHGVR